MKKWFVLSACFLTSLVSAFEYEVQFENEDICIKKVTLTPYEEVGAHRDSYLRMITAIQGGSIVRTNSDGSQEEIEFPTGKTITLQPDPEESYHQSYNPSSEPLELMITELKKADSVEKKKIHTIQIEIAFDCPESEELDAFIDSIPKGNASSFEEWQSSFMDNITKLTHIVENDKITGGFWSVITSDPVNIEAAQEKEDDEEENEE